jgi:hypothetical protein
VSWKLPITELSVISAKAEIYSDQMVMHSGFRFATAGMTSTQTTTLVIQNQSGLVISGLNISTTSGDCIQIINSTNVTIAASRIGPCGTNNTTANSRGLYISGGGGITVHGNPCRTRSSDPWPVVASDPGANRGWPSPCQLVDRQPANPECGQNVERL